MKNKLVNFLLLGAVLAFLAVLAYYVKTGIAADSVAVLKTSGMSCASCSDKITKALGALTGVVIAEVDVDGGWVVVGYDRKTISPELLADKVRSVGFASGVQLVLSSEQYKQITGRDFKSKTAPSKGCCGGNGSECCVKNKS